MGLPTSGAISFADLRSEYSDGGSTSLSEFYRGGSNIRNNYGNNSSIPTSGTIDMADFYNTYKEGTTLQKLEDFRSVRHSGAIWGTNEPSPGGQVITANATNIGGAISRYQSSDTCPNNTTRTSQHTSSEWTTIIGLAAMPGGSTRTSPLSPTTGTLVYNSVVNGNAACCAIQSNVPHNTVGNASHTFNRSGANKYASGGCIVMPGKWGFNRTINTASSSISLASGEIILWANERDGDGYSTGSWVSSASNCTSNVVTGWWYNTGFWGIATNGSSSSQTFSRSGEAHDAAWVFTESG
jgi:hypothetical protein